MVHVFDGPDCVAWLFKVLVDILDAISFLDKDFISTDLIHNIEIGCEIYLQNWLDYWEIIRGCLKCV